jgi:hypothetical protein
MIDQDVILRTPGGDEEAFALLYNAVLDGCHEQHILNNPDPLQYVEMREPERTIETCVASLPSKCRHVVAESSG